MADASWTAVVRQLHNLTGPAGDETLPDEQLLRQFAGQHDEQAFEALVRRHALLVWRVCRRLLDHAQDAEDAVQATFLVLARRAGAIRKPGSLASWLHGVACRIARRARAAARRRQSHERQAAREVVADPAREAAWRELGRVVEEELHGLPEKYRLPLLLCYWEGKTHEEAARQLGWPCGTLKTRLTRARSLLQARLVCRGVTLPAGVLALLLAPETMKAAVPAALLTTLVNLARAARGGAVSAEVAALAAAGTRSAAALKPAVGLALGFAVALAGAGTLSLLGRAGDGPEKPGTPRQAEGDPARAEKKEVKGPERLQRDADALPPRAMARLGTVRFRHPGEARELAFTPDGKLLAAECVGTGLIFWDADREEKTPGRFGKEVYRQPMTTGSAHRLFDFSPDGKLLAAVDPDADAIRCWDAATGKELRLLRCPHSLDAGFKALANVPPILRFAPDSKRLAVVAQDRGPSTPAGASASLYVSVLDATTGRRLHQWPSQGGTVHSLAFSPDGTLLAVSASNPMVRVWDLTTGKVAFDVAAKDTAADWAPEVAFAPDGKTLAVGTVNRIELVNPADGKERGRLVADMKVVSGLAFTPDGKTLASYSADQRVRVWDVAARDVRYHLDSPQYIPPCNPIALSPDGKTLVLSMPGSSVRLWDVGTGLELFDQFGGHDAPVRSVGVSPDGRTLVSGSDGQTRLWDAGPWRSRPRVLGTPGGVREEGLGSGYRPTTARALAWAPGNKPLALEAVEPGTEARAVVHVWDPTTGWQVAGLAVPDQHAILRYANEPLLAVGGGVVVVVHYDVTTQQKSFLLTAWDVTTPRRPRWTLPLDEQPSSVTVSADGKLALLGTGSRVVVCDLEAGRVRVNLGGLRDVVGLALSADGRQVAASSGRLVRLWELSGGQEVFTVRGLSRSVGSLAFSPDSRLLATGSGRWPYGIPAPDEPEIRLWDVFTGREAARFRGHGADTSSLCFTPDGRQLVSGHEDGIVLIWDVAGAAGGRRDADKSVAAELDRLWGDLAGTDAGKGRRAVGKLLAAGEAVVPFLRKNLQPAAVDAARLRRLIADLDSEAFAVRQQAARGIEELGDLAKDALQETAAGAASAEARKQAERLLEEIENRERHLRGGRLREVRAVEVLERVGGQEARQVLRELAGGMPQTRLTREAKTALQRPK
jgi:RNA polymerase sigma factor (sigma-70 family)